MPPLEGDEEEVKEEKQSDKYSIFRIRIIKSLKNICNNLMKL